MAKTKIFGEAIVVTSAIKLEDLKKVERYSRDSLILKGGEDGKQPIFGVCVAREGMGNISSISVSFAPTTRNAEGYATVTMTIPDGVANAKEWMVDKFGGALMNLAALEKELPAVVEKIKADAKAVADSIEE